MTIATYTASTAAALVAPAGTTPFFAITGSATQIVRVKRITIGGGTLTAVQYLHLTATKTSTSVSGGTPTALTKVPVDSGFGESTATLVNGYTAAPTAGTAVGVVASRRFLGQATTAAAGGYPETTIEIDFTKQGGIILRGAEQGLELAFSNTPGSAVTLAVTVEWDEE
jgi:hypothetical protein